MLWTNSWVVFLLAVVCKLLAGAWVWTYREKEEGLGLIES